MIAKLIVHGADRHDALDRLADVLDETVVEGVTTNLPFLRWLVAHPAFRDGDLSTDFLTRFPPLSRRRARAGRARGRELAPQPRARRARPARGRSGGARGHAARR